MARCLTLKVVSTCMLGIICAQNGLTSCQANVQVRGYSPIDPDVAPSPQMVAANQALRLQELTTHKQELLSELQGYQVHRIPGTAAQAHA